MSEYKATVMKVAIHPADKNPAYDDGVTYIEVVDEAAGAFLELSQGENKIQIDPEELDKIYNEAKRMLREWPGED